MEYAIDRQTLVDRVLEGYAHAGIHADRARLRLLALGAAARGVPTVRPRRGEPPPGRGRLPRHRRRRRPRDARRTASRSSLRLFLATTDPDGLKAAPFIQGWLRRASGIDVSIRSMTDAKLYDNWYELRLGHDHLLMGHGPRSGLPPVDLHERASAGTGATRATANPEYDVSTRSSRRRSTPDAAARDRDRDAADALRGHARDRAVVPERIRGVARRPVDRLRPVARARRRSCSGGTRTRPVLVRPIDGRGPHRRPEAGPTGWMWLVGVGAARWAAIGLASSRRRRRADAYYV